jgi:hypothetical protein
MLRKILAHLISGQTMPVYIAHEIVKPQIDVCLLTNATRKEYENIADVLDETQIDEIEVAAFDYFDIYNKLQKYSEQYLEEGDELILNFTGGTKIQSSAMFQFAMDSGYKAIYINGQNGEYILFYNGKEIERKVFPVKITPKKYLALSGYELNIGSFDEVEKMPKVKEYLSVMKDYYRTFLPVIKGKKRKKKNYESIYSIQGKSINIKLIHKGVTYYEISLTSVKKNALNNYRWYFNDGFWLEYWTYQIIRQANKFDYVVPNLKIPYYSKAVNTSAKNEIDILAMKGVIPYIFECKTGTIKMSDIDKLNFLRREYFGRYSRLFFVGNTTPNPAMRERLNDNNITFIRFSELEEFIKNLKYSNSPSLK